MKAIVTWSDGIEIIFTDVFKYLDYCERVLWSGEYIEGKDFSVEEVYENE